MRQFFKAYGFYLFGLFAIADLAGIVSHYEPVHQLAKPLLMPALFFTALFATGEIKDKWLLLAGLLFSFAGDVFLLFDSRYPICFIFGLVSFLITHVFYIFYFLRIPSRQTSLLKKAFWLPALVIVYVTLLLFTLLPHLGALKIPVIVYAVVLGSMLLAALHTWYNINRNSAVLFVSGAALFVISDSLLAFNKFYAPVPAAGFLVMLTYCAAQCCIVLGFTLRTTDDRP